MSCNPPARAYDESSARKSSAEQPGIEPPSRGLAGRMRHRQRGMGARGAGGDECCHDGGCEGLLRAGTDAGPGLDAGET